MLKNITKNTVKTQALDHPITITRFHDYKAYTKKVMHMSVRELTGWIEDQKAPEKGKLPWLKLANFGDKKSEKNCYRTNANMVTITGVEGDYDAERMTPEEARAKLKKAEVAALIYTTASDTPETPRWRVFCPLSGPLPPDAREDLAAQLNGILGGVLAPESFNQSLSYYAGSVAGRPVKTYLVEGEFIDKVEGLKPIYKGGGKTKPKRNKSTGEKTGLSPAYFNEALMHVPNPDTADRDYWFKIMCGVHHETDGSEEGLDLIVEWSDQHESFDYENTVKAWESIGRRQDEATGATVIADAKFHGGWVDVSLLDECWTPEELEAIAKEALDAETEAAIEELVGPISKAAIPARLGEGKAIKRGDGKPVINLHNTTLYLGRNLGSILPGLAYNLMTHRDEWSDGEIDDAALAVGRMALEQRGLETVGKELVSDAIHVVAKKLAYHPIRDYLDGLRWDGKPRLETCLIRHAGADDTPYTRAVSRKFLIAMIARVMRPGCKHDHTLVLSGTQGQEKSKMCRVLAGEKYFSDTLPSIGAKKEDAMQHLQGLWLVELAELAPSRKADQEDQKAFLSGSVDRFRVPYARHPQSFQRQCVFVGTTNDDQFLKDPTGGRRYWPVAVQQVIDVESLAAERDQLYAEAVAAFKAGEPWWLDREFEAEHAAPMQAAAYVSDSWVDDVAQWLDARDNLDDKSEVKTETTMSEVLSDALHKDVGQHTPADQRRAGAVLKQLGWIKVKKKTHNVWRRPQ